MKRLICILFIVVLCLSLALPAAAAYGFMDFPMGASVFFLDRAEKGGYYSLADNPFGIESIRSVYVESGSKCSFGGQDGYAMPPVFIRVDCVKDTVSTMSNPVYCGSPFTEEKYEVTVDELFAYCGITKGTALILQTGMEYVMLQLNGASLPDAEPKPEKALMQKQSILINDVPKELTTYALKDSKGGLTNYVRLRDVAALLSGTGTQFDVSWDGSVNILVGEPYTANGSEFSVPFSGDRAYKIPTAPTKVNGVPAILTAITLTDDNGGGYTYYKLRDLGRVLGFAVDWTAEKGIFVNA